jgi:hypothetical protein
MKNFLFISFSILLSIKALGQEPVAKAPAEKPSPIIKFAPLSILDKTATYQFGVEYFLTNRKSLQGEIGYGSSSIDFLTAANPKKDERTIRFRGEYRIYTSAIPALFKRELNKDYMAFEFLYKNHSYLNNQEFGRDCNGSLGCNYYEKFEFTQQTQSFAGHFKYGSQLFSKSGFVIDAYVGVGLRITDVQTIGLPDNLGGVSNSSSSFLSYNYNSQYFPTQKGLYRSISLAAGLKIGLSTKRKKKE